MRKWKPDTRQLGILAERYLDLVVADRINTLLLLLQAPIIAGCIMLVWGDVRDVTESLWYVLALVAVWFGCSNSCRELVKERPIFEREHRVGLNTTSYVLSKLMVLCLLGLVQCFCLVFMVHQAVTLPGLTFMHFLMLFWASLAGTGLGLMISALVSTPDRAVAAVPIFLLPQILFTEMVLNHDHASDLVLSLENCTITAWTYLGLTEIAAAEPTWWPQIQATLIPLAMAALFILVAIVVTEKRA